MTTEQLIGMIVFISDALGRNRDRLNQLDSALGDGDHGTGISTAFASVVDAMQTMKTPADVLKTTAMTLMNRMGGTSGALYGTLFLRASTAVSGNALLTPQDFAAMFAAGMEGVMQRGKAQVGDKTMLDALVPAVEAMRGKNDFSELFLSAADAANAGADNTAELVARRGRASFVGERAVGHIDAGAASVAMMFSAMKDYWEES